jgi:transposase
MTHALCWSHLRRKFFDSIKNYPEAELIVSLIDLLFKIEHKAENFDHLKLLRVKESFPIFEQIESSIKSLKVKSLSSSSIGKAINYFENGKEEFKKFLFDPYVPLSNNKAELSQRDVVMGRKNFQCFRSINGADTAMIFYTIIGTCKTIGLIPKSYLLEMTIKAANGEKLVTPYQYGLKLQQEAEKKVSDLMPAIPRGP